MSTALPYVPFPTDQDLAQHTSFGPARRLWTPGSFDYDVFVDKFWGDEIDTIYPSAKTSGGSITFAADNENAYLSIVANSGSGNYAGQGLGLTFTGDRGILMEAIIQLPAAITSFKFECGLTDSHTDDAGAVNQKRDTTTSNATDFAVIIMDTTDDTSFAFISANGGTVQSTQDITAHLPILSTTYRIAIRVEGDSVAGYINGTQVGGHDAGIEGGTKLTPWIFCQARTSSERIVRLYKWQVIQPAY